MDTRITIISTLIFVGLLIANNSHAAVVAPSGPIEIQPDVPFLVNIVLGSEGERINAVSGNIQVHGDVGINSVRTGNSIVSNWLNKPAQHNDDETDIFFSGVIPGGYSGDSGLLFSIELVGEAEGVGGVSVIGAEAFLADGNGTSAKVTTLSFQTKIDHNATSTVNTVGPLDVTIPEEFEVILGQDQDIFSGDYFVAFSAVDKGSGIFYYEVAESTSEEEEVLEWHLAESPYRLKNQDLGVAVHVKAVDQGGNIRIERIYLLSTQTENLPYSLIYVIIALIAIYLAYRYYRSWLRMKRQK